MTVGITGNMNKKPPSGGFFTVMFQMSFRVKGRGERGGVVVIPSPAGRSAIPSLAGRGVIPSQGQGWGSFRACRGISDVSTTLNMTGASMPFRARRCVCHSKRGGTGCHSEPRAGVGVIPSLSRNLRCFGCAQHDRRVNAIPSPAVCLSFQARRDGASFRAKGRGGGLSELVEESFYFISLPTNSSREMW